MNLVSATHILRIDTSGSDTVTLHGENMKLDEQVKRFYDLESFGINKREGVYDRFVKGISQKEGQYEIGLAYPGRKICQVFPAIMGLACHD